MADAEQIANPGMDHSASLSTNRKGIY